MFENPDKKKVKSPFALDSEGLTKYDRTLLKSEASTKRYFENQFSRGFCRVLLWIPVSCRQEIIDFANNLRSLHKESVDYTEAHTRKAHKQPKDDGNRDGLVGLVGSDDLNDYRGTR